MLLHDKEAKAEIAEKWDESSESYDSHHGHGIQTDEEHDAWIRVLSRLLPPVGSKILDVGCGTGEMTLLLAEMGYNVTGIDLSEKMLQKARVKAKSSKRKVRFERGDAEKLNSGDESFDVVINRHLLWTLHRPTEAIDEWKRVLKKNGKLIVIDGLWNDGSINHRLCRSVSDLFIMISERKDPRKGWYSKELNCTLPHPFGMKKETAQEYFEAANLRDISAVTLNDIRDIQRKNMPFSQRITYNFTYYLISGCKR